MTEQINNLIRNNEGESAIKECLKNGYSNLALFLRGIYWVTNEKVSNISSTDVSNVSSNLKLIRIKILANWTSTEEIMRVWNKMTKGDFRWNRILMVKEEPVDYYVVLNATKETIDPKRTIYFQMEPNMAKSPSWGDWGAVPVDRFFFTGIHSQTFNNLEWHINKTYSQLCSESINKTKVFSSIVSGKYRDVGQTKRIDFIKFLEEKEFPIDVYGENRWNYKRYMGSLPYHCKDEGLLPYKYTFNAENNSIDNYFTEKIVDGILSECLVFYWGCPNIKEYIDERAFVYLELSNFESDYLKILTAIKEDWHSQRLPFIKKEKEKILNELQFFPRVEKILKVD